MPHQTSFRHIALDGDVPSVADGTPANICIYFIFLETRIMGLHFVTDSIIITFIAD